MPRPVPKRKIIPCCFGGPLGRGIAVAFGTERVHVVAVEVTVAANHIRRASHLDAGWHETTAQLDAVGIIDPPRQEADDGRVEAQRLADAGGQVRHLRVDEREREVVDAAVPRNRLVDLLAEPGEASWILQQIADEAADAVAGGVAGPETGEVKRVSWCLV